MMNTQCAVCSNAAFSGKYCKHHSKALEKLKSGYILWNRAYGELSWERYLDAITKLDGIGLWILEVAMKEQVAPVTGAAQI